MKSTPFAIPALDFAPVTLAAKERYATMARAEGSQSADHAFSNLYLWNDAYRQEIAFAGERAAVRFRTNNDCYAHLFPIGAGPLTPMVDPLLSAAEQTGCPLRFMAVTEAELELLLQAYPNTFEITETRDCEDYLYSADSLATLSGKKLHGKRNHINAFTAAHTWSVTPLTPADFDACYDILHAWSADRTDAGSANERRAIQRAFDAFGELELYGALLIADERAVAFTVGSMLRDDTLCVHFEKALPDTNGAYPMINREFVRMMCARFPALTWINREDDMGIENLRKAKLSYHPAAILRKFTLIQK